MVTCLFEAPLCRPGICENKSGHVSRNDTSKIKTTDFFITIAWADDVYSPKRELKLGINLKRGVVF